MGVVVHGDDVVHFGAAAHPVDGPLAGQVRVEAAREPDGLAFDHVAVLGVLGLGEGWKKEREGLIIYSKKIYIIGFVNAMSY